MVEVMALIPARGGSKGLPRKNIKSLGGHPLIGYSIAAALNAKLVSRTVVTTDDPEIGERAREYGARFHFSGRLSLPRMIPGTCQFFSMR